MSRESIFKARIVYEGSKIHVYPYSNRRCPFNYYLSVAVINEVKRLNHDLDWYDTFIKFTHEGITYEQISRGDQNPGPACEGCAFNQINTRGTHVQCNHPYYADKPPCTGKIYVVKETKLKKFNNPDRAAELHLDIIQAGDNSVIKIDLKDIPHGKSVEEFIDEVKREGIALVDA